ncbi:hypothetical protein [Paeniglutamicibacter antarcticus]|uniref:hypothetical protein n=1 Tax=Paeniglutamicibacter antarcticus TaxID=494023 RepID=UPI003CD07A72
MPRSAIVDCMEKLNKVAAGNNAMARVVAHVKDGNLCPRSWREPRRWCAGKETA